MNKGTYSTNASWLIFIGADDFIIPVSFLSALKILSQLPDFQEIAAFCSLKTGPNASILLSFWFSLIQQIALSSVYFHFFKTPESMPV